MNKTEKSAAVDSRKLSLEEPLLTALLRLALPITFGNALQTAYQITDAFWIGRLGSPAMVAITVSFPVTSLTMALGVGFAFAGATLTSQHSGAGRQDMVDHVAGQSMLIAVVTSVVLGFVGFLLSPYLLHLTGVTPNVYISTLSFMRVSFISIFFVFPYGVFQALMRGVGQTKLPVVIVLITVLLNFLLDPLFIFGWGPIPPLGGTGAALATLCTQILAAICGFTILVCGKHGIHLVFRELRPDLVHIKQTLRLGVPGSIELSTRALGLVVMSFFTTAFGTLTTAAFGVGASVIQVIMIPAMGISMAVSTLVGQNIGAGNVQRATRVAILGASTSFCFLTIAGLITWISAPHFVAFFIPHDPLVISEGSHFIRISCLTWGALGIQACMIATFRASGNMVTGMIIALLSQWMVQLPLAYVLSKHTGFHSTGLWWSFPVTNTLAALSSVCWFAYGGWKTTRLEVQR